MLRPYHEIMTQEEFTQDLLDRMTSRPYWIEGYITNKYPKKQPLARQLDLLEDFVSACAFHTRRCYRNSIQQFFKWSGMPGNANAFILYLARQGKCFTSLICQRYMYDLGERNLASNTINQFVKAIRKMFWFLRKMGLIEWDVDIERLPVRDYKDTRGPGEENYQKMLRAARESDHFLKVRDIAVLRLLHDLGLRRNEVCTLDLEDYDRTRRTLAVRSKGFRSNDREIVTVPQSTCDDLNKWIRIRSRKPGPLFLSSRGGGGEETGHRIDDRSVYEITKRYSLLAGLDRVYSPHSLRHTAITTALDRTNGNIRLVQQFSRHSNPANVMIYDDARTNQQGKIADLVAGDVKPDQSATDDVVIPEPPPHDE